MNRLPRRSFLGACAALACGGTLAHLPGASAAALRRRADPVERNGEPKFKFSLAAYSYRSLLQGDNAPLTLHDFIEDCAAMGLEGTELTSYYFPKPVTAEYLNALKGHAFRLGLDISGTAVGNNFGHADPEARRREIDQLKEWIEYAQLLDAPVIRVFAGRIGADVDAARAHRWIVEGLEECCAHAADHGIYLALENHGGPTSTADGLLALVQDVQSPWFGVNLDTGNFHSNDIYGELERVAPYALNVQVKVVVSGPDGQKRPSDFKRIARILRDAHYRGYIVLEYEENEDPREACPSYVEQLREAFA